MTRDETDNESLLEKMKDTVTTVLDGEASRETADASPAGLPAESEKAVPAQSVSPSGETSDHSNAPDAEIGVVEYNRAAGVDSDMSGARGGVTLGDYGIAGQTDSYDGADVVAEDADIPGRATLDQGLLL